MTSGLDASFGAGRFFLCFFLVCSSCIPSSASFLNGLKGVLPTSTGKSYLQDVRHPTALVCRGLDVGFGRRVCSFARPHHGLRKALCRHTCRTRHLISGCVASLSLSCCISLGCRHLGIASSCIESVPIKSSHFFPISSNSSSMLCLFV